MLIPFDVLEVHLEVLVTGMFLNYSLLTLFKKSCILTPLQNVRVFHIISIYKISSNITVLLNMFHPCNFIFNYPPKPSCVPPNPASWQVQTPNFHPLCEIYQACGVTKSVCMVCISLTENFQSPLKTSIMINERGSNQF